MGFELRTSGIGSNRSTNWATTIALKKRFITMFTMMYIYCPKQNLSQVSILHGYVLFFIYRLLCKFTSFNLHKAFYF